MNNKGSYLLEVMFVLTLITSFLLFMPGIEQRSCEIKKNELKKTLNVDIQYGLSYSITHFTSVKIYTIPSENRYVGLYGSSSILFRRPYDADLTTNSLIIYINRGLIQQTVYLTINCRQEIFTLKINEKSGLIE